MGLYIDGTKMIQVPQTKFLGVIVDEKPTFKQYTELVCKKILKSVDILCSLLFY